MLKKYSIQAKIVAKDNEETIQLGLLDLSGNQYLIELPNEALWRDFEAIGITEKQRNKDGYIVIPVVSDVSWDKFKKFLKSDSGTYGKEYAIPEFIRIWYNSGSTRWSEWSEFLNFIRKNIVRLTDKQPENFLFSIEYFYIEDNNYSIADVLHIKPITLARQYLSELYAEILGGNDEK